MILLGDIVMASTVFAWGAGLDRKPMELDLVAESAELLSHFFAQIAKLASELSVRCPKISHVGGLLLTTAFQQRDPFFEVRHVSPLKPGLSSPILHRRLAQLVPARIRPKTARQLSDVAVSESRSV